MVRTSSCSGARARRCGSLAHQPASAQVCYHTSQKSNGKYKKTKSKKRGTEKHPWTENTLEIQGFYENLTLGTENTPGTCYTPESQGCEPGVLREAKSIQFLRGVSQGCLPHPCISGVLMFRAVWGPMSRRPRLHHRLRLLRW